MRLAEFYYLFKSMSFNSNIKLPEKCRGDLSTVGLEMVGIGRFPSRNEGKRILVVSANFKDKGQKTLKQGENNSL